MKKARESTVLIEKLVAGGFGLARTDDGKIILAEGVIPGEQVVVGLLSEKKDFVLAAPLRLLVSSPHRVEPPCPVYFSCGGCDLQHIAYEWQLVYKKQIVADLFSRKGLPQSLIEKEAKVSASPLQWGYRQRIRLHVDGESRSLGFHKKQSHRVQAVDSCPLAASPINAVLAGLHGNKAFVELLPVIEAVELLHNPSKGKIILLLHWRRKMRPAERKAMEEISSAIRLIERVFIQEKEGGRLGLFEAAKERLLTGFTLSLRASGLDSELLFGVEPGAFSQVNLGQNEQMVNTVVRWARELGGRSLLDLHCGMGNFALPLAMAGLAVCGVDQQRASIRAAGKNAARNSLYNCRFLRSSAEEAVKQFVAQGEKFDILLLDPPRSGCREVIESCGALGAKHIIYISCDPATMVRDLVKASSSGYRPTKAHLFDMFPQTHHIESAVLLSSIG